MEVTGVEEGEEGDDEAEVSESSHGEDLDGTNNVSGRNKRKNVDQGAESRKNKLFCHLAASTKGSIDTNMKKFLEGLVKVSFTILRRNSVGSSRIEWTSLRRRLSTCWGRWSLRLHNSGQIYC